jgi:hypothetical protein
MTQLTPKGAVQVSTYLDRMASLFQKEHTTLGIPEKLAVDFALRCDALADHVEKRAGVARLKTGELDPTQNYTEDQAGPAGNYFPPSDIGTETDGALLRNNDEPYMDTFEQEWFDELRTVQQTGQFSNAKAASEVGPAMVKKMAALLQAAGVKLEINPPPAKA